jgi:ABC-type lipoprotein release transport system permease subunit
MSLANRRTAGVYRQAPCILGGTAPALTEWLGAFRIGADAERQRERRHHLIGSLLYGVTSTDPMTFAVAALALAAVALAACLLPASRASHIAPAMALRNE